VEHDVVLRLDRATADDLYVALYELGEHIAAGAPITPPTAEEVERLGHQLSAAFAWRWLTSALPFLIR
jgi:hypothetical protein